MYNIDSLGFLIEEIGIQVHMMEHLDYLWTYLWYIVRHVTFVIYMW